MDVHVTFRHSDTNPTLQADAVERVSHLSRLFHHAERASVVFTVEKNEASAEILIHGDGFDVVARATASDLRRAFDDASAKAETQVKKLHEKRASQRRR